MKAEVKFHLVDLEPIPQETLVLRWSPGEHPIHKWRRAGGQRGWTFDYADEALDVISEGCSGVIYECGVEGLPPQLQDIRGDIEGQEPERVFGWFESDGTPHYFGLETVVRAE